ncbi:MAG TPA: hypothetical protein VIS10_05265 [Anaerolineales bacterium]
MREEVKMPHHELEIYRQLPMWKNRIQIVPTIPREMMIDWTYTFEAKKFAGLKTPILLLLGGDSPQHFRAAIQMLDSAIPGSRVVIMPGQQHIAMDTNPKLFSEEVLGFLQMK